MGHARKLEPVDDTAEPREAQDLSNADPADSQILVGQAVLDILESDPGVPPDGSISEGQDDADTSDDITRNFDMAEYISRSKREAETLDPNNLLATSRMKVPPLIKPSWAQRVLSWFKSRFGQSDLR